MITTFSAQGDPVHDMVEQILGEQEAAKRLVLTADSVPQDEVGLRQLIVSSSLQICLSALALICAVTPLVIIIIIKHVLIKVTLSSQRHCRGTAQLLTSKKEQAEGLIAGGRRQAIVAVYSTIMIA